MAITDTQQSAQFAASAAVSAAEAKQYALSIEKPIIDIAESVSEAKDAAVVAGLARDEAKDIASGLSASIDFELAAKEAEFESQMQGQRTAFESAQQDKESDFLSSQSQRETDFVESQTDKENRFQQFLLSSGYVFLGNYEDGPFQFSARNQYIRYNNQYYRLNAATDVGFTTTGTTAASFANDVTHFVLMDGDTLRQNLGSSELPGTSLLMHSDEKTVEWHIDDLNRNKLSFYDDTASGLLAFLEYAAASDRECVIDVDINLTSILNFDAAGKVINLRFDASINSDDQLLWLMHLGRGSVIKNPWFKNITTPWVISRFDSSGNVLTPGAAVLATLQQTNDEIGYQPTASDSDIYSSLSDDVKNQQICAGMIIAYSDGVDVVEPRGRYMALEFIQCNNCRVISPSFMAGKHQYGSILFSNTLTSAWGYGNCVIGGEVRYGSVSGAVFMRQRGASGGIWGGFKAYRCGESGVKTYQNNVDGRSARCYQMTFDGITAHQCGYDGVDVFADYGVQEERVDDYTLTEYAWGMLPTAHKVSNIIATDCGVTGTGTGMTADGQFNTYSNIIIEKSRSSGIFHSGKNNYLMNILVKNGNMNSAAAGAQIRMLGVSSISGATIITDVSVVTAGYGLFTTDAGTSLNNINLDGTSLNSQPRYPAKQNLRLGRISSTDTQCGIFANPQPTILANYCGAIHFDNTYALSGSERGNVSINPVYGGVEVKGIRVRGEYGGFAVHAVSSQSNAAYLNNGEVMFYESSGALKLQFKGSSGAVITYTLTAG